MERYQELISLACFMHYLNSKESYSKNISINNIWIISPNILKTRKIFLNGKTSLCEVSHLILQLKTPSRVVLIVNFI
jgi:hypothetical protein